MSFIATARPPLAAGELPVAADPWWPAIDPVAVRTTCRLDGTVTPARLQHALLAAISAVQAELDAWATARRIEGAASLADLPAPQLAGQSIKVHHYRRAVYAAVQAELAEAWREIDTTPQSVGKTERVTDQLAIKVDEHRRNQRWAISDLMDQRRTTIELI